MAFHVQNEWYFERLQDGSVRITRRNGDRILEEQVITSFAWASIVAAMSLRGEDGDTYQAAHAFHMKANP